MTEPYRVIAINGSPHEGFGNTSQMLAMLGQNLAREGLELEEIFLNQQQIGFCTGCGTCLETEGCWVRTRLFWPRRFIFSMSRLR